MEAIREVNYANEPGVLLASHNFNLEVVRIGDLQPALRYDDAT